MTAGLWRKAGFRWRDRDSFLFRDYFFVRDCGMSPIHPHQSCQVLVIEKCQNLL